VSDETDEITFPPRFGERDGLLTYGGYLRLPELLDQQRPQADPAAHDELLFITVHQAYELWFKLVLHELTDARDRLLAGETYLPRVRLERTRAIGRLAVSQVDVIDTMTPQDFLTFRTVLSPASGFQSVQFREVEFLSGLLRRLDEPSLWDGFLHVLTVAGFDVSGPDERFAAYSKIAHDRAGYGPLWDLAEALVEHDQVWSLWRARHVLMVERQIGTKTGTGGSTGSSYLRSRVELRFYPELWELRSRL
jgi:tryptophan 2,3-dioxygenase